MAVLFAQVEAILGALEVLPFETPADAAYGRLPRVQNVLDLECAPMSANIARVGPEEVVRESLPFVAVLIAVVLLVTVFPALTLTLPNLVF